MVPTLDISISRDTGPFIAGQSYNLTCTVILKNVTRTPTVEWLGHNNSPLRSNNDITAGDTVTVNCSTYITTLYFSTLFTSHGGQYSCRATLGDVNNTAVVNITVLSKSNVQWLYVSMAFPPLYPLNSYLGKCSILYGCSYADLFCFYDFPIHNCLPCQFLYGCSYADLSTAFHCSENPLNNYFSLNVLISIIVCS